MYLSPELVSLLFFRSDSLKGLIKELFFESIKEASLISPVKLLNPSWKVNKESSFPLVSEYLQSELLPKLETELENSSADDRRELRLDFNSFRLCFSEFSFSGIRSNEKSGSFGVSASGLGFSWLVKGLSSESEGWIESFEGVSGAVNCVKVDEARSLICFSNCSFESSIF